jgi:hypothetical protein
MGYIYNLLKMLNNSSYTVNMKVLILIFGYSLLLVLISVLCNYLVNCIMNNSKLKKYNV